jgi:hypothetical protein
MRGLALQCLAIAGALAILAAGGSGAFAQDFFKAAAAAKDPWPVIIREGG